MKQQFSLPSFLSPIFIIQLGVCMTGMYALYTLTPDFQERLTMQSSNYRFDRLLISPTTPEQVLDLIPQSPADIRRIVKQSEEYIEQRLEKLLKLDELDFNRFDQLDHIRDIASRVGALLAAVEYTHPDDTMRSTAHTAGLQLMEWLMPRIELNPELYQKLERSHKKVDETELSPEKKYYMAETIKGFQRSGVHLPEPEQLRLRLLYNELNTLTSQFERNIAQDNRFIMATRDELPGLTDTQIARYRQPDGVYKLTVDYPAYTLVMEECTDEQTRRRLWQEFNARGYPDNFKLLDQVATLRHELACTLGYPNFAAYQIDESMAGSVERAQSFLDDLVSRGLNASIHEAGVLLDFAHTHLDYTHDQLLPWDSKYINTQYKKQMLKVDNQIVRTYFPAQQTIDRLLAIYEQFFSMRFEQIKLDKTRAAWHPDVQMIAAYDDQNNLLGYLLLDLYPREGKFTHACHLSVIHAARDDDGTRITPTVALVIANFPQAHADTPALFLLSDVNTFFHEFGHAVHGLWGATRMRGFSGTNTKRDFVELPSQMLEEWLVQPQILKSISGHYQTGEPLPDDMIDNIIALNQWGNGIAVMRQLVFSQLSLRCFDEKLHDDVQQTYEQLYRSYQPYLRWSDDDHFIASFGHLMGYGAQYYGYLWSKVFALDIFDTLKKAGLTPQMGAKYRDMVLVPGGSQDPYLMISNFLGREPSSQPYFNEMGF